MKYHYFTHVLRSYIISSIIHEQHLPQLIRCWGRSLIYVNLADFTHHVMKASATAKLEAKKYNVHFLPPRTL